MLLRFSPISNQIKKFVRCVFERIAAKPQLLHFVSNESNHLSTHRHLYAHHTATLAHVSLHNIDKNRKLLHPINRQLN